MFTIAIEMPSGARSRGYERKTELEASKVADSLARQLGAPPVWVCDVVIISDGIEVSRGKIENAD